ncbi:MAG: cation:proton antiporter [Clostridia bacterium]|nr:cation:proton antiporter [Clostridia bacterium]
MIEIDPTILLILSIALALAAGILLTRLFNLIHLPNVTAYLVAGLAISPLFALATEKTGTNVLGSLGLFSQIALGFIAFSIGFSFRFDHLKKMGLKIVTLTVVQAFFTAILVDAVLFGAYLLGWVELPVVFVLGAIATATAPAATLLVIKQYNADGPVTQTLLPVVAIDDAVGLMVFAVSLSLSESIAGGADLSFITIVLEPLKEIVLSLLIGAALGFIVAFAEKIFKSRANRLTIIIICVFTGVAVSSLFNLSSLLLCMAIAAVYCNADHHTERVMDTYDKWTHPLYVLFFVVSGAQLDFTMVASAGLIGVLYLLSRSVGKYVGATLGATITRFDTNVKRYLGLALLPQAGVALGMAEIVKESLPLAPYAPIITTVVLCATLVYELIGPLITKWALTRAGEIPLVEKPVETIK